MQLNLIQWGPPVISIVIPAYGEEKQIPQTILDVQKAIQGLGEPFEIVLVDDGSRDQTYEVAQKLAQKHDFLKVVRHEVNQGLGAALRTGFRHSKGDKVVSLDCDLSFDPLNIPKLLPHLSDFDVVIGGQHIPGGGLENVPFLRVLASKIAYQGDKTVFGGNLPSYTSMLVAYRGPVIRALKFQNNSFAGQCEILVRLLRQNSRIKGVPTRLIWRDIKRQSSMNLSKEAFKRLKLWWQLNRFRHST